MKIRLNGKERDVSDGTTVAELVEALGYGGRQVVVERNGEAVERVRFPEVALTSGDVVEVVRPVQGGSV